MGFVQICNKEHVNKRAVWSTGDYGKKIPFRVRYWNCSNKCVTILETVINIRFHDTRAVFIICCLPKCIPLIVSYNFLFIGQKSTNHNWHERNWKKKIVYYWKCSVGKRLENGTTYIYNAAWRKWRLYFVS